MGNHEYPGKRKSWYTVWTQLDKKESKPGRRITTEKEREREKARRQGGREYGIRGVKTTDILMRTQED